MLGPLLGSDLLNSSPIPCMRRVLRLPPMDTAAGRRMT